MYAELSYFDGYHFQHIADYHEHRRIRRLTAAARRAIQGARGFKSRLRNQTRE